MKLKKNLQSSEIAKFLRCKKIIKQKIVNSFNSEKFVKKNCITFSKKKLRDVGCTIITNKKINYKKNSIILSENPRLTFCKFLKYIEKNNLIKKIEAKKIISKKAIILCDKILGNNIHIGRNTIIEKGAIIKDNVYIGNNCIIKSGAIIGAEGFGFEKMFNSKSIPEKFYQYGGVKIGNNVEIGSNSCVSSGTFSNTEIGSNTKIDNLVHIAHNTIIGKNNIITAKVQIAGSCIIGNDNFFAPSSTVKNKIIIENNCFIGIGSVVIFNVKNRSKVFGNPASEI